MINTYFIYKMKNGVDVLVKSDINGNSYRPPLGTYNSVKIVITSYSIHYTKLYDFTPRR